MLAQISTPRAGQISRVKVLVHPHFSIYSRECGEAEMKDALMRSDTWKGEMLKASQDSGTVFVIVKRMGTSWNMGRVLELELVEHARKMLKERFLEVDSTSILFPGTWDTAEVFKAMGAEELKGLLAPGARGVAFGEYTSSCVPTIAKLFEDALSIPFDVDRLLSLDVPYVGDQMGLLGKGNGEENVECSVLVRKKNPHYWIFSRPDRYVRATEFEKQDALADSRRD